MEWARGIQAAAGNRALGRILARREKPPGADEFAKEIGEPAAVHGQFILTNTAAAELGDRFDKARMAAPVGFGENLSLLATFSAYESERDRHQFKKAAKTAAQMAHYIDEHIGDAELRACVGRPEQAEQGQGAAAYEKVWKKYRDPKEKDVDVADVATMYGVIGLYRWEAIACKRTTEHLGRRVAAGRKDKRKRDPSKAIKEHSLAASIVQDAGVEPDGRVMGDVIVYGPSLAAEIQAIRAALDEGFTVHARCISGAYGLSDHRSPDHSILIYGHEPGGDLFFFDPDVAGTNLEGIQFGRLYHDRTANRLGTAKTDDDFPAYPENVAQPGGRHGFLKSGVHRYQVKDVWTM